MAEGLSLRAIALRLGRRPSTVSREVARHGGRDRYRAALADERAWDRARRRKPCKLATVPMLRELVAVKLAEDWSPQQISGWLARTYPGEEALQVSTETIYRSLFVQARGVLRKELTAHLRTRRTMRRSKRATRKEQGRGGIVDGVFSFSSTSVAAPTFTTETPPDRAPLVVVVGLRRARRGQRGDRDAARAARAPRQRRRLAVVELSRRSPGASLSS